MPFPVFITVASNILFSLTKPGTALIPEDRAESHGQDWKEGDCIQALDKHQAHHKKSLCCASPTLLKTLAQIS